MHSLNHKNGLNMSFFYPSGMLIDYSVLDLAVSCGYDFQTSPGGSGDRV